MPSSDSGPSPRISVIMPVRNCAATLPAAVRSVQLQSQADWELLLLEDGSEDDTLSVARSFLDPRIRVFSDGGNRGIAARLNQGIDESRGLFIARMDGDDISYPDRLQQQSEYLEKESSVNLLASSAIVFGAAGRALGTLLGPETHEGICRRPWSGFPLWHPTWMARREWFMTFRYQPSASGAEDLNLLLQSYPFSRFACLPQILLGYRQESLSRKRRLIYRRQACKALWQSLGQRRNYLAMLLGLGMQIGKGLGDLLLIGTPLEEYAYRYRSGGIPMEDVIRWENLWNKVNS